MSSPLPGSTPPVAPQTTADAKSQSNLPSAKGIVTASKASIWASLVICTLFLALGIYIFYRSTEKDPCFSKWWPRGVSIYIIISTVFPVVFLIIALIAAYYVGNKLT